uniref:Secreted protein n=1 Tax=Palpitomonas bilix TaxID=652834 RepID=A0A7S3GJQ0_9EUKA|mmetsp:Transcript_6330/g.15543  ORF Transcript_6330/g.15543 Transcript_6330/m.15543 type:complete len:115 (+) Transcript_6330:471-815(+)
MWSPHTSCTRALFASFVLQFTRAREGFQNKRFRRKGDGNVADVERSHCKISTRTISPCEAAMLVSASKTGDHPKLPCQASEGAHNIVYLVEKEMKQDGKEDFSAESSGPLHQTE